LPWGQCLEEFCSPQWGGRCRYFWHLLGRGLELRIPDEKVLVRVWEEEKHLEMAQMHKHRDLVKIHSS
jgi:hypothetical protein